MTKYGHTDTSMDTYDKDSGLNLNKSRSRKPDYQFLSRSHHYDPRKYYYTTCWVQRYLQDSGEVVSQAQGLFCCSVMAAMSAVDPLVVKRIHGAI